MCINTTNGNIDYVVPAAARYLATAVAVASALCSLAIVLAHVVLRCWRRRRHHLSGGGMDAHSRLFVIYLSACDVVACAANATGALGVYGRVETTAALRLCQAQSAVGIVATMAFVLWALSFVVFLYVMIPLDAIKSAIRYRAAFHVASWGIPVLVGLLAYFLGALPTASGGAEASTQSGGVATNLVNHFSRGTVGWCWIGERPERPSALGCDGARLLWMLVAGRGWELLAYAAMAVLVAMMRQYVNQLFSPLSRQYAHPNGFVIKRNMRSISGKAYALVMSLILLRVWGTIRVFLDYGRYYDQHRTVNDVFTYMQAVGDNAQGIVNFVLFVVMAPKIRADLAELFGVRVTCDQLCCFCCRRHAEWQRKRTERRAADDREREAQPNYCGLAHAHLETDETGQATPDSLTISTDVLVPVAAGGRSRGRTRRKSNASATSEFRSSATDLEMTTSVSPRSSRPLSLEASGHHCGLQSSGNSLRVPIPESSEAPSYTPAARLSPSVSAMTTSSLPSVSSPQPLSYTTRGLDTSGGYDVGAYDGRDLKSRVSPLASERPRLLASSLANDKARRSEAERPLLSDMDNMNA